MDPVAEIKSRLPIDELVRQYCQLTKKGRNFVALCPFHHDSHPSFLVSPDKGICYCFPCQKGGDIFSFYQLIEGVDFKQALKDLAEKSGVQLPERDADFAKKDEKDRLRECLQAAASFYAKNLRASEATMKYLAERGVSPEEAGTFTLGLAPDSFTATYEYLLKAGFSRKEIQTCGLGVQKDLRDEKIYDRFRNRLMFPIYDNQSRIIGFGGRALGNDDAKYLNSADSPLYHKSSVLYGLHHALRHLREKKRAVLVEGYFDVLACHRVGVCETVGTCGTALTDEHIRLLKRHVGTIVLCLDQDRAGREAAERAFMLCAREGLQVEGITLGQKDPADAAVQSQEMLRTILTARALPYLDIVCAEIRTSDLGNASVRHAALQRLLPLLQSLSSSTERTHAVRDAAAALGTTEMSLTDDLKKFEQGGGHVKVLTQKLNETSTMFTSAELTLGLFLTYPRNITLLAEMIAPEEGLAAVLYQALKLVPANHLTVTLAELGLGEEDYRRAGILLLYCEENGFSQWSDSIAIREIRRNCRTANREQLQRKQKDITQRLLEAKRRGESQTEAELAVQYQQLLQLSQTLG